MSRYIEYDAIDYRNYKMHDKSSDFIDGVIYMAQRIEDAPSIDIEPKQGKWIDAEIRHEDGVLPIQVCSECKTFYPLEYTGGGYRFCPNCGADMREREGE